MYKQRNSGVGALTGLGGMTSTKRKFQQKRANLEEKQPTGDLIGKEDSDNFEGKSKNKFDLIAQQIEDLRKTIQDQQEVLSKTKESNSKLTTLIGEQATEINTLKEVNKDIKAELEQNSAQQKSELGKLAGKLLEQLTDTAQRNKSELDSQITQLETIITKQRQDDLQKIELNSGLVQDNKQQVEKFMTMFKHVVLIAINNGLEIKEILDSIANFQMFAVTAFELEAAEIEAQFPDNSKEDKEAFLEYCEKNLQDFEVGQSIGEFRNIIEVQYTEQPLIGENIEVEI